MIPYLPSTLPHIIWFPLAHQIFTNEVNKQDKYLLSLFQGENKVINIKWFAQTHLGILVPRSGLLRTYCTMITTRSK